jgi:hypothetical protein
MTSTTTHSRRAHPDARRRLDLASAMLTSVGVLAGVLAYWLITAHGTSPLLLIPAIVATTIGATHLVKYEAPHR